MPHIAKNYKSSWAQYTLKTSNRELLIKKLKKADIPFAIYYPKPISRQTGYKKIILSKNNDKNSLLLSKKSLSIPVHSYLTESQLNFIIEKIKLNIFQIFSLLVRNLLLAPSYLLIGSVAAALINFIAIFINLSFYSLEELGVFAINVAIASFLSVLSLLRIDIALTKLNLKKIFGLYL